MLVACRGKYFQKQKSVWFQTLSYECNDWILVQPVAVKNYQPKLLVENRRSRILKQFLANKWQNPQAKHATGDLAQFWKFFGVYSDIWRTIPASSRNPQTIFEIPIRNDCAHHFSSLNLQPVNVNVDNAFTHSISQKNNLNNHLHLVLKCTWYCNKTTKLYLAKKT